MAMKELLSGPVARIIIRYLAGALVAYGLLAPDVGKQIAGDRDLVLVLGAALAALAEWLYRRAKRNGGPT